MKIVFMGTPDFAVHSLNAIKAADFNIVAVVTAPDKARGRGKKVSFTPVKEYALSNNIPVLQPTNLKDPAFIEELLAFGADIQVVVAFRMLPEVVWNMPPLGSYNVHASLLPNYRGAAPINWAIINGESKTGVTTFQLKHEIDTGNIAFQEEIAIEESDNAGTLHDKLALLGAKLIVKTLAAVKSSQIQLKQQTEDSDLILKHAPKLFPENCILPWETMTAHELHNHIRGLSPYPGARLEIKGESYKILGSHIEDTPLEMGQIETDNKSYLNLGTKSGTLGIKIIQKSGKKAMDIKSFFAGNKI
ncbi:MAG: methionyl-tRNA formyltransferase [Cyclobacteriaceae bacterium]|nr:methionyl-tRNA formyltransferase [Cyclobacteriaceae bacterium]MCH8514844.1 methionyl-tRNA formyltransferase [Cyclobacteriaceae bacterium]